MTQRNVAGCLLLLALVGPLAAEEKPSPQPEAELRTAATKALKMIQRSQVAFGKKDQCTSCHHQLLTEIPFTLARERGVAFDETIAQQVTGHSFAFLKDLDHAVQEWEHIDVFFDAWALVAGDIVGVRPTVTTDAYAQYIASRQLPDGRWPTIDRRPPQAHSPFTATAISARAVQRYLPERLNEEKAARVARAREWLLSHTPQTTEDRTLLLLGLLWTGADEAARKKAARQLLAEQRPDGGWPQLPTLESDAYSTGQALHALHVAAGLPTSDPAYQRGLRYLLGSQQEDGSWYVKTRIHPPAPISPPYFSSDFPYRRDQYASIMGTTWAAAALMHALPARPAAEVRRPTPPDLSPAEKDAWVRVAISGSAAELKALLDGGLSPNAKTNGGTTVLMMAARDPEKVKLLVDRGADLNARAATGFTPLMVASRYRGNAEVVRLLLKKGARANPDKDAKVRHNATALAYAAMSGDLGMAAALLDAGANVKAPMALLGQFPLSPLVLAIWNRDPAMVKLLLDRGADPNEVGEVARLSPLDWAVLANHPEIVQLLLKREARINHADELGMTPLLYAVSIDFGDTTVLDQLLAAGADASVKNAQGATALELARKYGHQKMAARLAEKAASR